MKAAMTPVIRCAIDATRGNQLTPISFLSNNAFGVGEGSCLVDAYLGF
jgi:hypothetical protein